ncbi:hypothetical protein TCE0_017r04253 [Talaromyces pinophilus]|uniref:Uncharacterized protein n=1 Tax=Talaromyces pinophilus TaxID=128442 RepID=A0A6V8H3M5_TALPI|nr:hypothetical protein DPV78_008631 [Talaromyces pinophilus]GAM35714.1 hypothetical protein TCE0_017r04253 [Talaromyces pinophilus]
MYRVCSVYDRVQHKLSERLTVEGKWIRRSASYRVRTQRTEALARQMKATCGITECPRSAWTVRSVWGVESPLALGSWSVTGQGFWTSAGDKEADETREEIEEGWSIV